MKQVGPAHKRPRRSPADRAAGRGHRWLRVGSHYRKSNQGRQWGMSTGRRERNANKCQWAAE